MMMGDQQSPQLAALMQQLGGGGAPDQSGGDQYGGGDPLQALQQCMQDLHGLVATMPDAQHTQMVLQALSILSKVQTDLMQPKNGGGAQ